MNPVAECIIAHKCAVNCGGGRAQLVRKYLFANDIDMNKQIYKIATVEQWDQAKADGVFRGAPIDLADGYIHFSTVDQVRETATKHFAGQEDLLLLTIEAALLGDALQYEASRGGALFPHLYAELPLAAVVEVQPLPIDENGTHAFPTNLAGA